MRHGWHIHVKKEKGGRTSDHVLGRVLLLQAPSSCHQVSQEQGWSFPPPPPNTVKAALAAASCSQQEVLAPVHHKTSLLGGERYLQQQNSLSLKEKHEGLEGKTSLALSTCYQAAFGLISIPIGLGLEAPQGCCSFHRGGFLGCTACGNCAKHIPILLPKPTGSSQDKPG